MDRLIKAKVEAGRVAIHWLGQAGFALKAHAGDVIVVDPYLSDSANVKGDLPRLVDIPIKPKDVRLDYLFLTHDHEDHTDPHAAPSIAQSNPTAPVICPPSSAHHLIKLGVPSTQITTAMPGQSLEFPNFVVHVVRAHHTEDSVGYIFEFNEEDAEVNAPTVYVTGDTEYEDSLISAAADYGPNVLIVPINGRWGNMDAAHAARLAAELAPEEVIPMHFGMFESNTADPNEFVALLAAETGSNPMIRPVVMKHNTCHTFCCAGAAQGRQAQKAVRSERARNAHAGHQHHDGQRGAGVGVGRR